MHFQSKQKLKWQEDSMSFPLVMHTLVYSYLIYTLLPSYFVKFCSKNKIYSKFVFLEVANRGLKVSKYNSVKTG